MMGVIVLVGAGSMIDGGLTANFWHGTHATPAASARET
jgi:hypothetical protein